MVSDFILHSSEFDGVVDFAKATADLLNPRRFSSIAGGTDQLHPNVAG